MSNGYRDFSADVIAWAPKNKLDSIGVYFDEQYGRELAHVRVFRRGTDGVMRPMGGEGIALVRDADKLDALADAVQQLANKVRELEAA